MYLVLDKVSQSLGKVIKSGEVASKVMDQVNNLNVTAKVAPKVMDRINNLNENVKAPNVAIGGEAGEKMFAKVESAGTAIAGKFGIIATALSAAYEAVKKFATFMMDLPGIFKRYADRIESYVSHINPAMAMRYEFALRDLWATIGEKLQPVFEAMIEVVEKFGDAIANLNLSNFMERLANLVRKAGETFIKLFEAMIPVIELIANVVIPALDAFAAALNFVTRLMRGFRQWIFQERPEDEQAGKRRAMASRGVSVLGLDQVSNRVQEAAGRIGGRRPEVETADNTAIIAALLKHVPQELQEVKRAMWAEHLNQLAMNEW